VIVTSTFDSITFSNISAITGIGGVSKVSMGVLSEDDESGPKLLTKNAPLADSYTIPNLQTGARYVVWIDAWDANDNRNSFDFADVTPTDSTGPYDLDKLAVSGATSSSIDITGFDLVNDNKEVASFDIFYATTETKPDTANTTLTKAAAGTKYTITGLAANTGYFVWVDAKDTNANTTARQVNATAYSTTAASSIPSVTDNAFWTGDYRKVVPCQGSGGKSGYTLYIFYPFLFSSFPTSWNTAASDIILYGNSTNYNIGSWNTTAPTTATGIPVGIPGGWTVSTSTDTQTTRQYALDKLKAEGFVWK
jgi:hypothetical protein